MKTKHKDPYRPNTRITQSFNDGIVTIKSLSNTAANGYKPVISETTKEVLRFAELRLGINRYYTAAANQREIVRVIRVPARDIDNQDIAVIGTEKYRIDLVQKADTYPAAVDLTLKKWEQ